MSARLTPRLPAPGAARHPAKASRGSPAVPSELSEQKALARRLDACQIDGIPLLWFHPPNGGKRDYDTAAALRSSGVKDGVPDVWIVTRPPAFPGKLGAILELKRVDGTWADVSPAQRRWLADLEAEGYLTAWAPGCQAALPILRGWGYPV